MIPPRPSPLVSEFDRRHRVVVYCLCGGALVVTETVSDTGRVVTKEQLEAVFWAAHDGPLCGEAARWQAMEARRRRDGLGVP